MIMRIVASKLLVLSLGAMVFMVSPADAQEERERRAGEQLSRNLCSECHIVSENQRGPVLEGMPSFPELARSTRTNAQLRAWLTDPHPPMPSLPLSEREIASVIAYIRSFSD
ncbi:MAG: cytochrome c [Rhodospirillaceae bacterium]|jgi:mono/diheme cytochrome c family protein|nr:cytochrome c [Rhodospirillaceae bacterium]MBT5943505.1 cytochrome c [Rhodospirillaceae bacterium]MBT6404937.1 cytochrome c [Rhodospirillaceae bacterium]MBT6537511.1 cytochrome c [Rhodospirillaceae bacterium]MBT7361336.1 cytochrome c [Rhodospirillaceae bacterium]